MNWGDRVEIKKGDFGEAIVDQWLISKGFIPYRPVIDCAHPFDRLVASRDKKTLCIVEPKTKPSRNNYPDTGINDRNLKEYLFIWDKYKIPIFLAFVDERKASVYGEWLHILMKKRTGANWEYPQTHNGITYFPLDAMRPIADLTHEQVIHLRGLRRSRHDALVSAT